MLEVRGIDVYYGHIRALRSVSLDVNEGEVVALIGANGAGKSTTLRAISALMPPLRGEVTLDGQRIDRLRPEMIVARGVGHLPEGRGIFPSLTVEENLRMGFWTKRRDTAGFRAGVERVTGLFPALGDRMDQVAGTLSGGEQQMLALARALLPEPRLLMVDELSLGLAPRIVSELYRAIRRINEAGTTILLVEQYVTLALKIAHRAYVLEKGQVATSGTPEEILSGGDEVRSMYLGGGRARGERPTKRSTKATRGGKRTEKDEEGVSGRGSRTSTGS